MKIISSEQRTLQTAAGILPYTFERKNIRNINLRIRPDGCVYVSAPENAEIAAVERFLAAKTEYIQSPLTYRSALFYFAIAFLTVLRCFAVRMVESYLWISLFFYHFVYRFLRNFRICS